MTTFIPRRIGAKINAILLLFFVFALTVILLTLNVAWQLEGGGAAINDAGSQRMRTYRLAYLLHQLTDDSHPRPQVVADVERLVGDFEATLSRLETGDPMRPLFLPREPEVQRQMAVLRQQWSGDVRPRVVALVAATDADARRLIPDFDAAAERYVPMINALVVLVEQSNARHTARMYAFQNSLVGFSLIGTLFLIYLLHRLVIRPVGTLRAGMERMAVSDLDVRLPVETEDEFGDLAAGFNRMADHLQGLYSTLEQRVAEKTWSTEEKNRELSLLYETTAYLAEPAPLEQMCQGVVARLCDLLGAPSGAVRLVGGSGGDLDIVAAVNLSPVFKGAEAGLRIGTCLCGGAAANGVPVSRALSADAPAHGLLGHCVAAGHCAVAAIPIRAKTRVLGVINLFFAESRPLVDHELRLLEAVGQHLGIAVENLRLVLREKEMAVSEERNLLAQELHDSIAQSLAFLNIQAQLLEASLRQGLVEAAAEELGRMREGIQESYDNVRELLVHFRIKVSHVELDDAIRAALEKFEGQTGIRTSFAKVGEAGLPAATSAIQVLHILQEALSNVRKHAGATGVDVTMDGGPDVTIAVRDDGRGFDPVAVGEDAGSHVGIGIMRERAHRIGARIDLDSAPGRGTCVTLVLPGTGRQF